MDLQTLENIKEFVLDADNSVSNSEIYTNLEGEFVLSYEQDGQKKLITIDWVEKKGE